jgi:hypothetical protein
MPGALNALRPPFRQLDTANHQVIPFAREATPIIRKQIRPFTRIARPYFRDLGNASSKLARANPQLQGFNHGLNRLFNMGAYNPNGAEGLSNDLVKDRQREEGYLYWLAWAAQNTVSLFNTADANGPFRRGYLNSLGTFTCAAFQAQADAQLASLPGPIRTVIQGQIDNAISGPGPSLQSAGVCK